MLELPWPVIVVAVLQALTVGKRVLAWCAANAELVRILAETLEAMASTGSARDVKDTVNAKTAALGGGIRALADAVARKAERKRGVHGSATRAAARESRGARIARALARWAPLVGLVL